MEACLVGDIGRRDRVIEVRIRLQLDDEIVWLIKSQPPHRGRRLRPAKYLVLRSQEGTAKAPHAAGTEIIELPPLLWEG